MGRGGSSGGGSRGGSSGGGSRGGGSSSRSTSSFGRSYSSSSYGEGGSSNSRATLIGFLMFGLVLLVLGLVTLIDCSSFTSVKGVCVKNDYLNYYYYTTYEYTIDGKEYTNRSQEGWEQPEVIGESVVIYYRVGNPDYITEKAPNFAGSIVTMVIGCAMIGVSVYFLCRKSKQEKAEKEKLIIKYENCIYCGSKCKSNETTCSNCGASRMETKVENFEKKDGNN